MSYQDQITQVAIQQGVDPALALAVAQKESSFNPNALSNKGAVGLFQLMPGTAKDLGVDAYDPIQNIQGGIAYLKKLLGLYDGDTSLALAAYNAGPGNVDKYGGVPPFPETQNYVQSILSKLGLVGQGVDGGEDSGIDPGFTFGGGDGEFGGLSVWVPIVLVTGLALVIWNR